MNRICDKCGEESLSGDRFIFGSWIESFDLGGRGHPEETVFLCEKCHTETNNMLKEMFGIKN